jgi:hypothetical protein
MGKGEERHPHTPQDAQQNAGVEQEYDNTLSDQQLGYVDPTAPAPQVSTALEHRDELPWMDTWSDADLHGLRIYREAHLHPGEIYFDLRQPERGELKAAREEPLNADDLYVAKQDVPHNLWDRLTDFREHGPMRWGVRH